MLDFRTIPGDLVERSECKPTPSGSHLLSAGTPSGIVVRRRRHARCSMRAIRDLSSSRTLSGKSSTLRLAKDPKESQEHIVNIAQAKVDFGENSLSDFSFYDLSVHLIYKDKVV